MDKLKLGTVVKEEWLSTLYSNFSSDIFTFTFNRPVKDYSPEIVTQLIKTDNTLTVALCNYLTVYNHVENKTLVLPVVHGLRIETIIMLIECSICEGNLND